MSPGPVPSLARQLDPMRPPSVRPATPGGAGYGSALWQEYSPSSPRSLQPAPSTSAPGWMTPASPTSNPLDLKQRLSAPMRPGTPTTPSPLNSPVPPRTPSATPATPSAAPATGTAAPSATPPTAPKASAPRAAGSGASPWAGPAASGAIAGGLDAARRVSAGQPLPQALGGGAITGTGAAIGTGIGAGIGTLAGPAGTMLGGILGGYLGGAIGGAIADKAFPLPTPTGGSTVVAVPGSTPGVLYRVTFDSGNIWGSNGVGVAEFRGPISTFVRANDLGTPASRAGITHGEGERQLVDNGGYTSSGAFVNILSVQRLDGLPDSPPSTPSHPPAPSLPQTQRPLPGSNPGPQPSPEPSPAPTPIPTLPPLPQSNLPVGNPTLSPSGVPSTAPAPAPTKPELSPNGVPSAAPAPTSPSIPSLSPAPGGASGSGVSGSPRGSAGPQSYREIDAPNGFEILPNGTRVQRTPTPKDWDSAQPALKPKPNILSGTPRTASPTPTYAEPTERPGAIPGFLDAASPILPGLGIRPNGSVGETPKTQSAPQLPPGGNGSGGCEIGGCGSQTKAAVERVDSKLDTLLGGVNAGSNAAQLALLNTINTKLGAQIPNGGLGAFLLKMQDFAEKAWKATHLDKVLNALTLITALHNAMMLSRSLGSTLGELTGLALQVIGIKDETGGAIDVSQVLGGLTENFIKSIVGEETYNDTKKKWAAFNRIVQSTSQIIWTVRSMADSTGEIIEWAAENTGKIGNALKRFGVVGERAYKWMPERVRRQDAWTRKLDRVREGVESLDDAASSLTGALGEVRSIQEEFGELNEQKQNLATALKDGASLVRPDNEPVKQAADAAKTASGSPDLTGVSRNSGG
jgi:hypothetical protein